jgi:hypothetical protein
MSCGAARRRQAVAEGKMEREGRAPRAEGEMEREDRAGDGAQGADIGVASLRFAHLREIRDYTYKDVLLADTKAGFALTVVGVSLAACAALFDRVMNVQAAWGGYVFILLVVGLSCACVSVLCAMLTILPRSYISHEMTNDPTHWVHLKSTWRACIARRLADACSVVFENIWQKQTKGTTQSLGMLMDSSEDHMRVVHSLHEAMARALLVQNLKYLWVGKALLFAFAAFALIGVSLLLVLVLPGAEAPAVPPWPGQAV